MSYDYIVMYHSGLQSLLNIAVVKSCLTTCNMLHVQVNEKKNCFNIISLSVVKMFAYDYFKNTESDKSLLVLPNPLYISTLLIS